MSQDNVARTMSVKGTTRTAVFINLIELYAFWVGAHAFSGPMSLLFWTLLVITVLSVFILVATEIISGVITKMMLAQEAREVAKAGKF